jgi:hypothetical protein
MGGVAGAWVGGGQIDCVWGEAGTGLNGALAVKDLQAGFRSDVIRGMAG